MTKTEKMHCDMHGEMDVYMVCIHVVHGAKATHKVLAEDADDGTGIVLCAECDSFLAARDESQGTELTSFEKDFLDKNVRCICRGCAVTKNVIERREGDPPPIRLSLINGETRNSRNPKMFQIPPVVQRHNLIKGDMVKLGWEQTDGPVEGRPGERMWVEVQSRAVGSFTGIKYVGKLKNTPFVFAGLLRHGQEISFGPEHVLNIGE